MTSTEENMMNVLGPRILCLVASVGLLALKSASRGQAEKSDRGIDAATVAA